jgi:hypothetical protein
MTEEQVTGDRGKAFVPHIKAEKIEEEKAGSSRVDREEDRSKSRGLF